MDPIEDARRDEVISQLRRHHAAGRLDAATLKTRVDTALHTTSSLELDALLWDLPTLTDYVWAPGTDQQVVAASTGAVPAAEAEQSRFSTLMRTPIVIAVLIMLGILFVMSFRGFHYAWWMAFFIMPVIGQWMKNHPPPPKPPRPPRPPSGPDDRFDPDGPAPRA